MSDAGYNIREWRFIIEDELTQVYVHLEAWGDCPIGVQGWHHKTYPKSKSVQDILIEACKEGVVLWPQAAPESR